MCKDGYHNSIDSSHCISLSTDISHDNTDYMTYLKSTLSNEACSDYWVNKEYVDKSTSIFTIPEAKL